MKKVVVFVSQPDGTLLEKTFEVKNEEEFIEAVNTDKNLLVILVNAQIPKYTPTTLAVFKDWLYWERLD